MNHSWFLSSAVLIIVVLLLAGCADTQEIAIPAANTNTMTPTDTQAITSTSPPEQLELELSQNSDSTPTPIVQEQKDVELTITIVYDNNRFDPHLRTAWGFAAIVEYEDITLLFDTGGDGRILLSNMDQLGMDPTSIQYVVLSHEHGDHVDGLEPLLRSGIQPPVFVPPSFTSAFKQQVQELTSIIEVEPGMQLVQGFYTTGEMGGSIREQALVIHTSRGLIVITGCAHPGIVNIIKEAVSLFEEPIYLVLGGFHLSGKSEHSINSILSSFREVGVEKVAPAHCTGDQAIAMFAAEYGEDYIKAGVGKIFQIERKTP